jgi:integrase
VRVDAKGVSRPSGQPVHAIFYLVSPEKDPAGHLRLLAQLASCVEQEGFMDDWLSARSHDAIREVLLRDERYLSLALEPGTPPGELIGLKVRELGFPQGCLVAIIRRRTRTLIPRADMVLDVGDRLTVIGERAGVDALKERFSNTVTPDDPQLEDA